MLRIDDPQNVYKTFETVSAVKLIQYCSLQII